MEKAEFSELIKMLSYQNDIEISKDLLSQAYALYRETENRILKEGGCDSLISMLDYYALVPDCYEQYAVDQSYTIEEAIVFLITIELAVIESDFYGKNLENS